MMIIGHIFKKTSGLAITGLCAFLMVVISGSGVMAQDFSIEGRVLSAQEETPLTGVTIQESGTATGTFSDIDGNFSLSVSGPDAELIFTYVGFQADTVNVDGRDFITVFLQERIVEMQDEVVITALGLERDRQSISHSITSINAEDLVRGTESNVANLLQGQVAGVEVTPTGGGVGASSRVVIRGVSSLDGHNQPLYVVDGIPIDNRVLETDGSGQRGGNVGMWGGFDGGDGIQSINPADIESMTVLRGASAAALYGERAKDGVILITTKQGESGSVRIEFSNTTTFDFVHTSHQDWQTDYGQGYSGTRPSDEDQSGNSMQRSWGERMDGRPAVMMDGSEAPYEDLGDPQSRFYQTGVSLRNDLVITGGTEASTYYISASNLSTEGIIPNSTLDRTSLTLRGTATIGRLRADARANYINEDISNRPHISDLPGNINSPIRRLARNVPISVLKENVYHEDGSAFRLPSGSAWQSNPYWVINEWGNQDDRDRLIGSLKLDFEINDWLLLTGRTGIDTYDQRRRTWRGWGTTHVPGGNMNDRTFLVQERNTDLFLTGNYDVTSTINMDGMFGGGIRKSEDEMMGYDGDGYIFPGLTTISNMETSTNAYGFSEKEVRSLYGSMQVGYREYLYFNFTGRNDWSSTLPDDGNSFFYPSIGASLVFSEAFAPVMPDWISFGQLRASWAEVGSDTSPYRLNLDYRIVQPSFDGNIMAEIGSSEVPLADLKPSITQEVEIGTDIRFLDDKIGIEVAWYDRQTTNQILGANVSTSSGYDRRLINAGRIDNTGYEVQLNVTPVATRNFFWRSSFNYARNKSMVVELIEGSEVLELGRSRREQEWIIAEEGKEFGQIWGRPYLREPQVDASGNILRDEDGNPIPDPNGEIVHVNGLPVQGALTYLGRGTPTWTGGMTNRLSYKSFSLNAGIGVQWGGQIYSGSNAESYQFGRHKNTLIGREEADQYRDAVTGNWLPTFVGEGVKAEQLRDDDGNFVTDEDGNRVIEYVDNDVAVTPYDYYNRIGSNSQGMSEEFVYDANVIYVRQIQLGYRVPARYASRIGANGASVSIVARNPFVIYSSAPNIDPTQSLQRGNAQGLELDNVPSVRSVGFNIDLQF